MITFREVKKLELNIDNDTFTTIKQLTTTFSKAEKEIHTTTVTISAIDLDALISLKDSLNDLLLNININDD